MFLRNSHKTQARIDTLIGAESMIEGDVKFSGGLRVDGCIRGNVTESGEKSGTLVLSEHGRIEGAIAVSHAVINGSVVGPLKASAFLELQAKSRVSGDVCYRTLEIHMGAVVEGKLIYIGEASQGARIEDV